MHDFFARLLGRSENMHSGANYWLYEAVPMLDDSLFGSSEDVKRSIDTAIAEVTPDEFDPDELVVRIEEAQDDLSTSDTKTELLIGLDEVALFIGDGRNRYREFQETIEALTKLGIGPIPRSSERGNTRSKRSMASLRILMSPTSRTENKNSLKEPTRRLSSANAGCRRTTLVSELSRRPSMMRPT
nr:hypothetical protein [Halocatena pleomorpha]